MLNINLTELFKHDNFLNCYFGDDGHHTDYPDSLYVRFSYEHTDQFSRFLEKQEANSTFITSYDLPEGEIMLVFKIPPEKLDDYNHFKAGRYSKIDKRFITRFFQPTDPRFLICFKRETVKKDLEKALGVTLSDDAELDSIPDLETEIFRYNNEKHEKSI
jgi:hypothetical protein